MKKRKWLKKGLALALSACMVIGMVPGDVGRMVYAAESEAEQSEEGSQTVTYDQEYNIADGSVTIDKAGTYLIYSEDANTPVTNAITVGKDISATITLENVNIDVSNRSEYVAFKIEDNSTGNVTVNLVGKNSLTSGFKCAGLQKNGSGEKVGTLTIKGNGELTAIGGFGGSGIGGGFGGAGSNIEISGGTVTATGGNSAAGIGGGAGGAGSNIEISGGTVTATGGDYAAGIGGGIDGTGSNIEISDGTVTATGGDYAAGIGGGDGGAGSNIRITGGSVKAIPGSDFEGVTPHAIGGGVGRDAVTPTNKDGKPVYLLEIENPNAAAIQVNGNAYTPISHGEEAKIYAYLPAGTKDTQNVVTVGDTTKAYWYDATSAKWNDTLTVASVPAADKTTYTYNGTKQTYRIAESNLYTVTGNVQKEAREYTVTVSLKDSENSVWSDGTKKDRTYTFTIQKATLDTSSIELMREFSCVENISKVSDVSLPDNWHWDEADQSKVLEAGSEVDVTAVYDGLDKENFTEESRKVTIRITKKAHTDADKDGRCDVEGCGAYIDGVGARLAGYSLSLAGNIGVNFYMELSDDVAKNENAYMNFKLPNGMTTKVYVTGTHADGATATQETVTVDGVDKEYYVFPCEVAAKEMTANIKAQIIAGDMEGTEYTYTVKDYADYIWAHKDQYGTSTVNLVNSMLNYGGYAQEYFDYRTDDLANQGLTDDEKNFMKDTVKVDTFSKYKAEVTNAAEAGTFVSAYLSLKSRTDLCVYVKLADGVDSSEVTFAVDDQTVSPDKLVLENVNGNDYYKLTVSDIAANQLGQMHTFTVTRGSGENAKKSILKYGAFSYAYTALSSDAASIAKQEELCNALKAMYNYYFAAKNYYDQLNQ